MDSPTFYSKAILDLLEERKKRNSNYSMRALARDLSIDPSNLSKLIKGKTTITPQFAYKLANHIGLQGEAKLDFIVASLE